MPVELWLAYVAMCFLFAITPGPAVLLTAGQAIARGFSAGFAVVLGTQLGNLGLFRAFRRRPRRDPRQLPRPPSWSVKYAGAAYLVFLGLRTIRNARKALEPAEEKVPVWRHPFTQGLLNQLANPKSILFWGALFPQFVDFRADNLLVQFAILAVTGIVADIIVLSSYAAVAARGGRFMASGPQRGLARADFGRGPGRRRRRAVAGQAAS